jgi:hypothetical protein
MHDKDECGLMLVRSRKKYDKKNKKPHEKQKLKKEF